MDLAGLVIAFGVRVQVEHAERLPRIGGALVVANRGLGLVEPAALAVAVRVAVGRRLRVIGAPDTPVLGDIVRKIGAVGYRADDVAALLRAGHLRGGAAGVDVVPFGGRGAAARSSSPPSSATRSCRRPCCPAVRARSRSGRGA